MKSPRLDAILETIAANVRHIRNRRGLSQEQLAEAADIDLRQLSRIETAKAGDFAVSNLLGLCDALDVRLGELVRPRKLPAPKRGRPVRLPPAQPIVPPRGRPRR